MPGSENTEYNIYYNLFKNNYRKGVHALYGILNTPILAEEFLNSPGALAAILSVDIDKNSTELAQCLAHSNHLDAAIETWIKLINPEFDLEFSYTNILTDEKIQNAILQSSILAAIGESQEGIEAILANEAFWNKILNSYTAMRALISSNLAIQYILQNLEIKSSLFTNKNAIKAIVESQDAIDALLSEKRQYTALKQNISNISTYLNTCIKNLEKPSELIKSSYTINGNSVDGGNFKKIRQELIDNKNLLNTILDEIDKKIIEINGVIQ